MSREAVEQLMDKWLNEATFRAEFRKDPEGAVRELGVSLDQDEWDALRAIDWSLSDEELKGRANFS